MEIKPRARILKLIFKDFASQHSVTSVAKEIDMTRQGAFKILKKLESEKLLLLSPVGQGRTSTYLLSLNWQNQLLEKMLALLLTEEALQYPRWLSNFSELENKVVFSLLYGSILKEPKAAHDIDFLTVANKKNFVEIDKTLAKIQKTQLKKIHALNFTGSEFRYELKKPNPAFVDAIKKSSILFGQENFIKFIRGLNR